MRKLVVLLTVGILAAAGVTTAFACGDKLLALGRGLRMGRAYTASHTASLLIYVGEKGGKSTLGSVQLQSTLKKAGHKVETVGNPAGLKQGLKTSKVDL